MGIFGELDADSIPDNPFFVEAGEYRATVVNAFFDYNETRKQNRLVIVYNIIERGSKYFGKEVRDWFDYYPEITKELYAELAPEEQGKVDKALSAVKRRLCGVPKRGNKEATKGLGINSADLNKAWEPRILVNTEVDLGIVNSGEDNEYTNIKWVEKR